MRARRTVKQFRFDFLTSDWSRTYRQINVLYLLRLIWNRNRNSEKPQNKRMKYDWFVLVNEKDVSSGCSYSICSLFRLTHFKFAKNYKCWVLRSYSAPKQIERYFIFINLLLFFYLVVSICVHREIIMDEINSIFCTEHQNELLRSIVYLFERSLARCLSVCVFPLPNIETIKAHFDSAGCACLWLIRILYRNLYHIDPFIISI